VFEGAHGSGKTTQAKRLVNRLRTLGYKCIYTEEPFSKKMKPVINFYSETRTTDPTALALLVAGDRYVHLQYVADLLRRGFIVVCDRYYPSSWVYQTIQGVPRRFTDLINRWAPRPDLLFIIETPLKTRLQRITSKKTSRHDHYFLAPSVMRDEQRLYSAVIQELEHQTFTKVLNGRKRQEQLSTDILSATLPLLTSRGKRHRQHGL
jgi:dTMP kinase